MEFLDKLLNLVNLSPELTAGAALIVEFALRLFKSEKPLSLLYVAAALFHKVGNLFGKVGQLLDKVIPQRLVK